MIGYALKKLAKENNLTISNGLAYGNFHGYAASFYEGAGTKTMVISSHITNDMLEQLITQRLESENLDLEKNFRVQNLSLMGIYIHITFLDNPGTMKKIYSFIDWFFPLLKESSATAYGICPYCCQPLEGDSSWTLMDGIPVYLHDSCAGRIEQNVSLEVQREQEINTGNYGSGFVGALFGALLGAVVWAIVLFIGYYAAIVGFLIGFLAKKGYKLLHGKKGKGKLPIILFVTMLGVVGGTFLADILSLFSMVYSNELYGLGYGDVFPLFKEIFKDPSYIDATLRSIGAGLFFALLGIIDIILNISRENKPFKIKKLK